jgi:hypothetical protein
LDQLLIDLRLQGDALNAQGDSLLSLRLYDLGGQNAGQRIELERALHDRANTETAGSALKRHLVRDGLIDPSNYSFELTANALRIDGKKQNDVLHRKYLAYYRAVTGKELKKGNSIRMEEAN